MAKKKGKAKKVDPADILGPDAFDGLGGWPWPREAMEAIRGENPHPDTDQFWILWTPDYHAPPKARFYSFDSARDSAEAMAHAHGGTFYVLKMEAAATRAPTEVSFSYPKVMK